MKNILISTFFVLLCLFTEGRANQAYFNHLDVKDGLSQINIGITDIHLRSSTLLKTMKGWHKMK